MFQSVRKPRGSLISGLTILGLIYHSIVRSVRRGHSNAFIAIGINLLQAIIFVLAFYVMFNILGLRGAAIRGDFLLYIMSGIFVFLTHTKAMGAVVGSEGPASPMMQHAPMNTIIAIASAAIGALYIQVMSMAVILFFYHVAFTPITIDQPIASFGMMLVAWFVGVALGLVLLAMKPWAPQVVTIFTTIYQRANTSTLLPLGTLDPGQSSDHSHRARVRVRVIYRGRVGWVGFRRTTPSGSIPQKKTRVSTHMHGHSKKTKYTIISSAYTKGFAG